MNRFILSVLRCPICTNTLKRSSSELSCSHCSQTYQIVDGIPILVDMSRIPKHLKKQIEYFEEEDIQRTEYIREPWQREYADTFIRLAKLGTYALVIDNATGSGYMALELARHGYTIIATDVTLKELKKLKIEARRLHVANRIYPICCTSEAFPLKSNIADGLIANAILEHVPNERVAIKEITRVIKAKATIMVAMPIAYRYLLPILWPLNWFHDRRIGHLRRYTRDQILRKFWQYHEIDTYYTGSIGKVICAVLFLTTRQRWLLRLGEILDKLTKKVPYGSSNVVSVLRKI